MCQDYGLRRMHPPSQPRKAVVVSRFIWPCPTITLLILASVGSPVGQVAGWSDACLEVRWLVGRQLVTEQDRRMVSWRIVVNRVGQPVGSSGCQSVSWMIRKPVGKTEVCSLGHPINSVVGLQLTQTVEWLSMWSGQRQRQQPVRWAACVNRQTVRWSSSLSPEKTEEPCSLGSNGLPSRRTSADAAGRPQGRTRRDQMHRHDRQHQLPGEDHEMLRMTNLCEYSQAVGACQRRSCIKPRRQRELHAV